MKALFGSLSFRLALTYIALFATSLLLVLGSYYVIVIRMPLEATRAEIAREAKSLQNFYIVDGERELAARLQKRIKMGGARKPFHAFIARDGRVVSANLPSWPRAYLPRWWRLEADDYLDGDEIDFEALTLDHRFGDGARLLVGRDIENISEIEEALASGAVTVVIVALVVGILGGGLMSLAIGRRIEVVNATALRVMAGDLSQRIPVRGSRDDFDRLAETLNLMLARIEEALEAVRRVSDSVAHELRTPLTRLRADLDEALSMTGGDRDQRLAAAMGEADRLEKIFDAVLRIARIETGRHSVLMRPVDLAMLLEDAADYYRPAAEERSIRFDTSISAPLMIAADADLVFQAIANLLDNAIKYTGPGGTISLAATIGAGTADIVLTDDGPGIAPEHRSRVTERFYRGSQSRDVPGFGLGLSLVAAVADLHRSAISFEDAGPGLRLRWSLALTEP